MNPLCTGCKIKPIMCKGCWLPQWHNFLIGRFLSLGLWLRFSENTKGFFKWITPKSTDLLGVSDRCAPHPTNKTNLVILPLIIYSVTCVYLFIFRSSSTDSSGYSDTDCGRVWKLCCLQWEALRSASGEIFFLAHHFLQPSCCILLCDYISLP